MNKFPVASNHKCLNLSNYFLFFSFDFIFGKIDKINNLFICRNTLLYLLEETSAELYHH